MQPWVKKMVSIFKVALKWVVCQPRENLLVYCCAWFLTCGNPKNKVVEPKKLILIGDGSKSGIREVDESTSTKIQRLVISVRIKMICGRGIHGPHVMFKKPRTDLLQLVLYSTNIPFCYTSNNRLDNTTMVIIIIHTYISWISPTNCFLDVYPVDYPYGNLLAEAAESAVHFRVTCPEANPHGWY